MSELIVRWKNGETAIYRFTTKGDAVTAKMIFENHCGNEIRDIKINALEQQPILEKDGTLIVTTEHYENVGRVLVQHGTSGTLFYQDHEPCEEREQGKCPFYAS